MKTTLVCVALSILAALVFSRSVARSQGPAPFVIVGGDEAVQRCAARLADELRRLENSAEKEPTSAAPDHRFITTDTFKDIDFDSHIPQDVPMLGEALVASSEKIDPLVRAPFEFILMAFSIGMAR